MNERVQMENCQMAVHMMYDFVSFVHRLVQQPNVQFIRYSRLNNKSTQKIIIITQHFSIIPSQGLLRTKLITRVTLF